MSKNSQKSKFLYFLGSKKISGQYYINFLQSHNTVFLAKEMQSLSIELTKNLFLSVLKTWPLLLIAIVMAVIAGCIVWFLVSVTKCHLIS